MADQTLHRCPKCDGVGRQARPPWLPHEQSTWTDNSAGRTYPCVMCDGRGFIVRNEARDD